MNKFMRELTTEELTKYVGGINLPNETNTDDGGHGGGSCKNLLRECMLNNTNACDLFKQYC